MVANIEELEQTDASTIVRTLNAKMTSMKGENFKCLNENGTVKISWVDQRLKRSTSIRIVQNEERNKNVSSKVKRAFFKPKTRLIMA